MPHVLIVDDEPSICWGLRQLASRLDCTASVCSRADEALAGLTRQRPDAVLLDVRLPGMSGLDALPLMREQLGSVPIIVMTAYGELSVTVESIRRGAFEYLAKPFDLATAEHMLRRALKASDAPASLDRDEAVPPPALCAAPSPRVAEALDSNRFDEEPLLGRSPQMQEVFRQIALVAPTAACVHLVGESGTGKELVARAVHAYSRRADRPLITVNIAALSPSLIESELFGHVKGAFTGAETSRTGLLEQANGGTIFLDEVAEIPLAIQVKLLRAVERGEIWPVGSDRPRRIDCRIISATHRDLRELIAANEFRHDLYYRLVTFSIALPALRDRTGDLELFVRHFVTELCARHEIPEPEVPALLLAELSRRRWMGNVRELRNAVEHALILARGETLRLEHFPAPFSMAERAGTRPAELLGSAKTLGELEAALAEDIRRWSKLQLDQLQSDRTLPGDLMDTPAETVEGLYAALLRRVEAPLFAETLRHTRGAVSPAARVLGLHRTTLRRRIDELGLGELATGTADNLEIPRDPSAG